MGLVFNTIGTSICENAETHQLKLVRHFLGYCCRITTIWGDVNFVYALNDRMNIDIMIKSLNADCV